MDDNMDQPGDKVPKVDKAPPEGLPQGSPTGDTIDVGDAVSYHSPAGIVDGTVEVALSPDAMSATASFFPPRGDGLPIDPFFVSELLRRLGVVSGILDEEIAQSAMSCNLDRRVLHNVVVAKGSESVTEIPEHASLDPKFKPLSLHVDDKVQHVDFRELATLFVVKAGETIATVLPKRPGVLGKDVRGKETPFSRESPEGCTAGRNVERREDKLVARVDGRLSIEGGRADVDEVLLVKGEVDFHTGHIIFPGDVVIEGAVHDGFKVWSGGSIVCKSTMDAFDVNAKKDLSCSQGIIGRRRGQVRVGGELRAKYIQNCRVAARGDMKIASAVVNSRIYTLGSLDMGDKGVIMGGEVFAMHGVRCGRLGNQAFQSTNIHVGTDFTVQQKLDQANEKMRLLAGRVRQVDQAASSRPGPEVERARAELAKIAADLRSQISDLLGKLDADDGAIVEARGEIFPGVVIEICRVSIVVEEKLHACRFRLDKAAGRIVVER
jgi:Predicted polymerase, most proteins contain PALM domain, HD hydrolase domain and Zn-ribbon domain